MSFIKILGNPVLREVCPEIQEIDSGVVADANKLKFIFSKQRDAYGIAAPQIGLARRMFIFSYNGYKNQIVINPDIVSAVKTTSFYKEGCLSIPKKIYKVERATRVVVNGLDLDGNKIEIDASNMLARIMQHEIDHLNGILIVDREKNDLLLRS